MNPIPLSDPSGRVYAYACGVCRHVRAGAEMLVPHDDETVARLAEGFRARADGCCRCERCGGEYTRAPLGSPACEACRPDYEREQAEKQRRWDAKAAEERDIRERSLLTALDRDAACRLAGLMSEISETYYCAGWLMGLERELWAMVQGGDRRFGFGDVEEHEVEELRRLHEKCGGWWVWRDGVGAVFVPTSEWRGEFETRKREVPA